MEDNLLILLGKLSQALVTEKQYEMEQYQMLLQESSIPDRKKEGLTWHPVSVKNRKYALSSVPIVTIEKNVSDDLIHQFQSGSPVVIFSSDSNENVQGVIHNIEDNSMSIGIHSEDFPEWIDEEKIGVNLSFDSKTFFEMEKAMNRVINSERDRLSELRDIIYGVKKSTGFEHHNLSIPVLNDSQNLAVNQILCSNDLMIVHGPPGTGKTTTLVEAIFQLSKKEKRILVCAPSNAAVDHLVRKLSQKGLSPLRIGNLAKFDEALYSCTVEGLMRQLPEFKQLQRYKKLALEMRDKAGKYKRNFGKEEREERRSLYREARELIRESRNLEDYMVQNIISNSDVVCTTLIGSTNRYLNDIEFSTLFIDEAAQGLEPACWVPILKSNKVVLAGDPFQLPPTVKSMEAEKMGLSKTLMEKSMEMGNDSVLLNVQYRMNSLIMDFSNSWFYKGELKSHESVAKWQMEGEEIPVEFIDTAGCGFEEKSKEGQFSKSNPGEIEIIEKRIKEFTSLDNYTVGIISPYKEQTEIMRKGFANTDFSINTVDSFQGQERDVIIISLVRSNADGEIGFLKDYRRMNVAMTRARKKLVVVGDSATVGQDKFYEAFLNYCESKNFYRSAWEYMY